MRVAKTEKVAKRREEKLQLMRCIGGKLRTENGKWKMENVCLTTANKRRLLLLPPSQCLSLSLPLTLSLSVAELLDKQSDRGDEIADEG